MKLYMVLHYIGNMIGGFCTMLDGLITVLSLGMYRRSKLDTLWAIKRVDTKLL